MPRPLRRGGQWRRPGGFRDPSAAPIGGGATLDTRTSVHKRGNRLRFAPGWPMPGAIVAPDSPTTLNRESLALASEWRRLGRAATAVAVLTSPVFFAILSGTLGLALPIALALTVLAIAAFRGLVDVVAHWLI